VSSLISGRQRDFQTGSPSAQSRGSEASRGGRTWWAHYEFGRMNIELTILKKEIEDAREVSAIVGVRAAAALWP